MGEQMIGKVFIETENGDTIEFEKLNVTCISENDKEYTNDYVDIIQKDFSIELNIKNITKKRFIKLLISKGIQRNKAIGIADYTHRKYGHYNPLYIMKFLTNVIY